MIKKGEVTSTKRPVHDERYLLNGAENAEFLCFDNVYFLLCDLEGIFFLNQGTNATIVFCCSTKLLSQLNFVGIDMTL